MTTKEELQATRDSVWERYGTALTQLSTALDKIDKLEKRKPEIKEIEVEVEKIVEVERKVEVPKEVVVTREVEVPGPERVVTKVNPADEGLRKEIKKLKAKVKQLEKQKEKIVTVEKSASGDLRSAARLLATSEMNKEDLSEDEIFDLLQKSSEEEVKKKIGFWAQPLPDPDQPETTKRYIGKK